jgi:predicted PurR-regulated permease PerM
LYSPSPRGEHRFRPIVGGFLGTVGVGIALGLFYLVTNVGPLPLWIIAALFIALGLDPAVRMLHSRGVPRGLGVTIVFAALLGFAAAFISLLVPITVEQLTLFFQSLPGIVEKIINTESFQSFDATYHVKDQLTSFINQIASRATDQGGIVERVIAAGQAIVNGVFGTLIVLVLALYFLAALPAMKKWGYLLVAQSKRTRVAELTEQITRSVGYYVLGQTTVAALNATFALIVMLFLGIPYPWLFFCVVAILAFIPLVGPPSALVVVTLVALTKGWGTALAFAIIYMVYLQFEAYFVSPKIMQRAVSVPGPVAVIAVIAGGSLLGVLGAVMAIPTAAAIMILIREVYIPRQQQK